MSASLRRMLVIIALGFVFIPSAMSSEAPLAEPARLNVSQLKAHLPALRQGGFVIYFRHMSTNHEQEDRRPVDLNDCATQRPLSAKGREQAIALGKAVKQLGLPIGKLTNSPFCRCVDTARLAFGRISPSDDLYFAMGLSREGKQAKGRTLRAMFATPPAQGTNTVIVAHTANLQEAVGLWPKPEGVAYIFAPQPGGKFTVIGMVNPETWVEAAQNK